MPVLPAEALLVPVFPVVLVFEQADVFVVLAVLPAVFVPVLVKVPELLEPAV